MLGIRFVIGFVIPYLFSLLLLNLGGVPRRFVVLLGPGRRLLVLGRGGSVGS